MVAAEDSYSPIYPTRVKFLAAVSNATSIVTLQWLVESQELGRLLPVDDFLISTDEDAEREHNFSLQKSIANGILAHSKGGICRDLHVFLTAGVAGAQGPSRATFKALFDISGATERTKSSVKTLIKKGLAEKLMVITSDPATAQQINDAAVVKAHGAKVITFRQYFQILLTQTLKGILTPETAEFSPKASPSVSASTLSPPPQPKKRVDFGDISPKKISSPFQKMATKRTTKEVKEEWSLLFSTQIPNLERELSDRINGNQDRGSIGAGTMNITSSNVTGRKKVEVYDRHHVMKFQSTVLPTFRGVFGNAGSQPKIIWDAYDTSGSISTGAVLRTFEFTFRSKEQMTIVLFIMFGGHSGADADNAVKLTEDFFDEKNEIFCPQTPSKPPFPMIESEVDMSIDQINGAPFVQRPPPLSPQAAEDAFGSDALKYSQAY